LKLYRDGRLFNVPGDLLEENDLSKTSQGTTVGKSKQDLQKVLDASPPAPVQPGQRTSTVRPTYPNWRNLVDPND